MRLPHCPLAPSFSCLGRTQRTKTGALFFSWPHASAFIRQSLRASVLGSHGQAVAACCLVWETLLRAAFWFLEWQPLLGSGLKTQKNTLPLQTCAPLRARGVEAQVSQEEMSDMAGARRRGEWCLLLPFWEIPTALTPAIGALCLPFFVHGEDSINHLPPMVEDFGGSPKKRKSRPILLLTLATNPRFVWLLKPHFQSSWTSVTFRVWSILEASNQIKLFGQSNQEVRVNQTCFSWPAEIPT